MLLAASIRFKHVPSYIAGATLLGLAFLAVLTLFPSSSTESALSDLDAIVLQYCVPAPPEARVTSANVATMELSVAVPNEVPAANTFARSVVAHKGDVVRMIVESPTGGAVGVHGISDIVPIRPGQAVNIAFRLIYSGRFPLHFHGVDGSHFEIVALEVHD
jgi:hypothetical protein